MLRCEGTCARDAACGSIACNPDWPLLEADILSSDTVLAELQRRWRNYSIIGGAALAALAVGAALATRPVVGLAWVGAALATWLYQAAWIARRLDANHRPSETSLLPEFGSGTNTTFARGWLLACLAGFLVTPMPSGLLAWIPALLYMLADVADYLDGYLARITDHSTSLGEALDIELDALGLLIAVAIAIRTSALPMWYLPVGLARYAFIFGLWARRRAGKSIHPLPHSESRRPLAGLQMGALTVILVPALRPPVTTLGGSLLAVPLLLGFARDWLVASGAVDPSSATYRRVRERLRLIVLRWLPVPLRAVVVAGVLHLGAAEAIAGNVGMFGTGPLGLQTAGGTGESARLIELVAGAAVGLGFAPRFSAAVLLGSLLMRGASGTTSPDLLLTLAALVVLLLIGGGALSIWQPEIGLFRRRAGEKEAVD